MTAENRVRHAVGDLFIQLQAALAQIDELKTKIAELEKNTPIEPAA